MKVEELRNLCILASEGRPPGVAFAQAQRAVRLSPQPGLRTEVEHEETYLCRMVFSAAASTQICEVVQRFAHHCANLK